MKYIASKLICRIFHCYLSWTWMHLCRKVFDLLVFAASVLAIFYVGPVVSLILAILKLNIHQMQAIWCKMVSAMLRIRYRSYGESQKIARDKRTLLLFTHRTWGDFIINEVISDSTANYLSRYEKSSSSLHSAIRLPNIFTAKT